MTVGYRESLEAITYWSVAAPIPLDTVVGPYHLLSVETAGQLKYESPDGQVRTIRRILAGDVQLDFRKIFLTGTSATGFSGRNPKSFQRKLRQFDPFKLTDWPATREDKLPDLARQNRFLRDNFGLFHSDIVATDVLPDGWETWDVLYVDPINGKDGAATHDGTTLARAYRNLYKALTPDVDPDVDPEDVVIVVPDGAEFGFGDQTSSDTGNLWPISQTSGQTPKRSFVIMPQSAYTTGSPSGHWTSSSRLKVQWSNTTHNGIPVVRGIIQAYSPPITGANLSGWTTVNSGAVFDLAPTMSDDFGFGSRYKSVAASALQNLFEYSIENNTSILIFVPGATDQERLSYAVSNLQVYANWIQGKIYGSESSSSCYVAGRFLGGTPFRGSFGSTLGLTFDVSAYRCVFAYAANDANGFKLDGPNSNAARLTAVECTAAQNGGDGFGYYGDIAALEVNCFATSNGAVYPPTYVGEVGTNTDNQGFTTHGDCTVLRVACWSYRSRGPNYQDTNFQGTTKGTRVIMLGCYGGESAARVGSRFPCDVMVGEDTATDPNTWVWLVAFKYASPAGIPSLYTANLRTNGKNEGSIPPVLGARIYTTDGLVPGPIAPYTANTTITGISL